MHLADFFQWLNNLPFSVALREDDWPFPIIETVHILGLGLSVGVIVWLDLRLIGVTMKRQPMKCYTTLSFRLKAVMLVLTGVNVWYFHAKVYPTVASWDDAPVLPWQARMVGYLSIILWFGIIIAGRWTAYF